MKRVRTHKTQRPHRRAILATLGLAAFAAPVIASGCGGGFAPISEIDGLRVLAVVADKPYANPGDTVHFTLTYDDGYNRAVSPTNPDGGPLPPPQIAWIGGCFDPTGDEYYACYAQIAEQLAGLADDALPAGVGFGTTFSITLPTDLVTRRAASQSGTPYGVAFVFFLACEGTLKGIPAEGTSAAGSLPIGCFDASGNRLGADSFVPGYTEVYAFADGRTNANPVITGFTVANQALDGDAGLDGGAIPACSLPEDMRNGAGCGAVNPFSTCSNYQISVQVPNNVAEIDPATKNSNGQPLHEAVWVDYFADRGDIQTPILLVSDPTLGIQGDYSTIWIPPPTSGVANLWAVVHDSRGGEAVIERQVTVQ